MRDENKERYPSYVPYPYRLFLKLRKVYRQVSVRQAEAAARRKPPEGIIPDGEARWPQLNGKLPPNPPQAINKSAVWIDEDLARPELKNLADAVEALKETLKAKGLRFTNTAATFLPRMFYPRSERTKLWENVWTFYHSGVKAGHRVLDVGGASTPFSFYLGSMGCAVSVLDNDWGNCGTIYNANYVAKKMGWDLKALDGDISKPFPFPDNHFDRVFSICTIEHLPSAVRRFMMKEVGRVLKPGGIAGVTFCYDGNHRVLLVDKGLRFGFRKKFEEDVIQPSGLQIYGNTDLVDFQPKEDFLGAIFLEKNVTG